MIRVRGQRGACAAPDPGFSQARGARSLSEARALHHAAQLGVKPSRITVRDTPSRWGSCSSARSLSFSWRLILAPDFVLDYVVAHEVAHLREMNHSPRFWAHVQKPGARHRNAAGLAEKPWPRAAALRRTSRSLGPAEQSVQDALEGVRLLLRRVCPAAVLLRLQPVAAAAPRWPPAWCPPAAAPAGPLPRCVMKSWKICAGRVPPVALIMGALLSLPIHTPQTRSAVKPTNQASWKSWVVPVLPALGRSSSRAALPVPWSPSPSSAASSGCCHWRSSPRPGRERLALVQHLARRGCGCGRCRRASTPLPPLAKGA